MPKSPTCTLQDLDAMNRAALIATWEQLFGTAVPKRLSLPFLRRFIAFELQARQASGLPRGFATRVARASRAGPAAPVLKHGGRLVREWNGVTHVVDVVENGFVWNGQRHASLSQVARAITGARWSGPRFFGLKRST